MRTRTAIAAACMCALGMSTNVFAAGDVPALTGSLSADLALTPAQDPVRPDATPSPVMTAQKKVPIIAGIASLVLPGAGEVYNGQYLKGAIFFAAEVVGITVGIIQNNKGDVRTTEFQNYAEAHWSAVKYATFLNTYAKKYRQNGDNANIDLTAPRDVLWEQINAYESTGFREGFSHKLPKYQEQQYYELIGKYNQFKYGWDQYPVNADGTPMNDTGYNDQVPQQLLDYAKNRGTANDFYSLSRTAFSLVVVNHLLSAVDAYLSAHHINAGISSHMSMDMQRYGDTVVTVPQLTVNVGL